MKKTKSILSCILLLAIMLASVSPILADKASSNTIVISNVRDLLDFAEKCSFDKWSQDKLVLLDADIDLRGIDFVPIPTFGGSFDGKGHTIKGLSISVEGSNQGFFRYVQEGARVKNLNLEGIVIPNGERINIGGLVGYNKGILDNCNFLGYVKGKDSVGGIVGWNGSSGIVINSLNEGVVHGQNKVGGIVGFNSGSIISSRNQSNINTRVEDAKFDYGNITIENINISKLTSDTMDIGGIAGLNTGLVKDSENKGIVGYQSRGYNIGGIVGRQSGYVTGCSNYGTVYGRKEVAGIVGQMEPHIDSIIPKSKLEQLKSEMDLLQRAMTRMIGNSKITSNLMTKNFSHIQKEIDYGKNHIQSLVNEVDKLIDKDIREINKINLIATEVISRISPISDSFNKSLASIEEAMKYMKEGMIHISKSMENLGEFSEEYKILSGHLEKLNEEMEVLMDKMDLVTEDLQKIIEILQDMVNESNLAELLEQLARGEIDIDEFIERLNLGDLEEKVRDIFEEYENGSITEEELIRLLIKIQSEEILSLLESLVKNLAEMGNSLRDILDILNAAGENISNIVELMGELGKEMKIGLDNMVAAIDIIEAAGPEFEKIIKGIDGIIQYLASQPQLEFQTTSEQYQKSKEDLFVSMDSISKSLSIFVKDMNTQSNIVMDDMQKVSDQLFKVMDIFFSIIEDLTFIELDPGKKVEDISGVDIDKATEGKVSHSRNFGDINADINAGGIAGAMSVEVEFDPEEDLLSGKSIRYDTVYQSRAIILSCINMGKVSSKKNNAGGIVGNQDLGYIKDTISSGSVESTDGDYVGGIAGYSKGTIDSSYAKGLLSGGDYIGGIVGYGRKISKTYTLVSVNESKACVGAIAGNIDNNSDIKDNYFVSNKLRGIDGISYSGKAEPISYEELIGLEGIPSIFKEFKLEFYADNKLIKSLDFIYGDSLEEDDLPPIPDKDKYYGIWEEFDLEDLIFDGKVHAKYLPYTTLLESKEKRDEVLSIFLVEGEFKKEDSLKLEERPTQIIQERNTIENWSIMIPEDKNTSHTIRYLPNSSKSRLSIFTYENEKWEKLKYKKDGKYLVFEVKGNEAHMAFVEKEANVILYLLILLALLAIIMLLVVIYRRKRNN